MFCDNPKNKLRNSNIDFKRILRDGLIKTNVTSLIVEKFSRVNHEFCSNADIIGTKCLKWTIMSFIKCRIDSNQKVFIAQSKQKQSEIIKISIGHLVFAMETGSKLINPGNKDYYFQQMFISSQSHETEIEINSNTYHHHHHHHHHQFNVHFLPRSIKGMDGCFPTALGRQSTFSNILGPLV